MRPTMASEIADRIRAAATLLLPLGTRQWLRAQQRRLGLHHTPVGAVDYGDLGRLTPISPVFGLDRSVPTDRPLLHRGISRQARCRYPWRGPRDGRCRLYAPFRRRPCDAK